MAPLTRLILLALAYLHLVAAGAAVHLQAADMAGKIIARQNPNPDSNGATLGGANGTPASDGDGDGTAEAAEIAGNELTPECRTYARIANLSTIASNISYSAAFLQNSPRGTHADLAMFAEAQRRLPALTANVPLNTQCGNWTTLALAAAESNFTQGIVGEFNNVTEKMLPLTVGMEIVISCILCVIVMGVPWLFMLG